jgi:lysophospholipase L1-like esterase
VNERVKLIGDGRKVFVEDYGARFLQPDGSIARDVMADFLHPTAKGYQIWADALAPDIDRLMRLADAGIVPLASPAAPPLHRTMASDPKIAVMGRTQQLDDGGLRFSYPGVSMFAEVEGKTLVLEAHSTGDRSYLDVSIDQGPATKYHLTPGPQQLVLFDFAVPGPHRVEIVHRSETWHGIVTATSLATDGRFLAPPVLPRRKMLVLGDSVTCGEAIDRVSGARTEPAWTNPRQSYGMLAARQLGAQVQLVCMGGHGLVRSWNGVATDLNLLDYYRLAIPDQSAPVPWDQAGFRPDLIVSAIGTNDFSQGIPDHDVFVPAYLKLIDALRADHPKADILLTEGAILNGDRKKALTAWLNEVASRRADPQLHYVPSAHYPGDETDAHPTRAQHAAMAGDLVREIGRVPGWK